jgi:hypothetical protein
MKFANEQLFPGISPADYEALYFDEPFNTALSEALHMGRKLLRLDRTATRIVRHVCFEPRREAGTPADQAFGTSRASFVEELEYDLPERRGRWRTIPNLFTERVTNAGTLELLAEDRGTRRVVRGEVRVSLFGFGKIVERMVVAEIEKSYAATARFTLDHLALDHLARRH